MRTDENLIEMLEILKNDKITDVRELVSQIFAFSSNSSEKMELEESGNFEEQKTNNDLQNGFSKDNNDNNFRIYNDNTYK